MLLHSDNFEPVFAAKRIVEPFGPFVGVFFCLFRRPERTELLDIALQRTVAEFFDDDVVHHSVLAAAAAVSTDHTDHEMLFHCGDIEVMFAAKA